MSWRAGILQGRWPSLFLAAEEDLRRGVIDCEE